MTCPGGCIGGGGQPKDLDAERDEIIRKEGDFQMHKFCWNCLFCRKKNIVNCYMCKNLENKLYPSWSNLKYEIPIINKLFIYKNKRKKK